MGNELSIYQKMADPIAAIRALGEIIDKSGQFKCENPAQGQLLAWECLYRNMPAMAIREQYHMIFGQLSMRSDTMLANFNRLGGIHRPLVRTSSEAKIELTAKGAKPVEFQILWDELQNEPFVYVGKEDKIVEDLKNPETRKALKIKPKYATPRSRMQMLWARVVSDGIRTICPEANKGFYTPEEVSDYADNSGRIVDAEFSVTPQQDVPASESQKAMIVAIWDDLKFSPEVRLAQLRKRGSDALEKLPANQAADLIAALMSYQASRESRPVESPSSPAETAKPNLESPTLADDLQIAALRSSLQGQPAIVTAIRSKVESIGGLKNLTARSAQKLSVAIEKGLSSAEFAAWLSADCEGYTPF